MAGWIYVVGMDHDENLLKIGRTENLIERMKALQVGNPYELFVLFSHRFDLRGDAVVAERRVLNALAEHRMPRTEWVCADRQKVLAITRAIIKLPVPALSPVRVISESKAQKLRALHKEVSSKLLAKVRFHEV